MNRISTMATILASHPGVSATAQRQRLLTALLTMGNVTTYEASRHLDLYDPRARKHELVARGYDVETVLELLFASLVSCHPAPAIAAEPVVFCSSPATQQREFPRAFPVASPPVAGYAGNPHPHGETGLAARYHRRTTAHSGFFVRVRPCLRYDRLGRGTFGFVGSDDRSANLVQSVTRCLAASGDGLSPIIGVTTMTTPARIPSAARQRSIKITALILLSLKTGAKTGTIELQQRITREGIPVTLRTVQRHLIDLAAVLPIDGDGERPQGWRWRKTPAGLTLATVLAGGAA